MSEFMLGESLSHEHDKSHDYNSYFNHQEQTLGGNTIQCREIVETLSVKSSIIHNKRIYPGKKLHRYPDSAEALGESSHLRSHERILPQKKSYNCETDENSFIRSSNLASHKRQHTGEGPYECRDCGKVLNSISHLKKHLHSKVKS